MSSTEWAKHSEKPSIISYYHQVMKSESACRGEATLTTKVDEEMQQFVDTEADALGVSRTEYLRRVLDSHREEADSRDRPQTNRSQGPGDSEEDASQRKMEEWVSDGKKDGSVSTYTANESDPEPRRKPVSAELWWTVDDLEKQLRWLHTRVEALTSVSSLAKDGSCPSCGATIRADRPLTDLRPGIPIECTQCGLVVGHRE